MQKRIILFLVAIIFSNFCNSQTINKITFDTIAKTSINIDDNQAIVNLRINEISIVQKNCGNSVYNQIFSPELKIVYGNGKPALPTFEKIIEIPDNVTFNYKIIDYKLNTIDLNQFGNGIKIIPTTKPVSKKYSLSSVNYIPDSMAYQKDEFGNNLIVKMEKLGVMRNKNLLKISVLPFDYNAKKNILKIYNSVDIKISFSSNKNSNSKASHGQIVDNQNVSMVIVAHPLFKEQVETFAKWKTMQGFIVKTVFVNQDISNSQNVIKNYLKNLYNNPTENFPAPSYIVFVGDVSHIPSYEGLFQYGSDELEYNHVTDLYYCEYTGDYLPDVMYGRISANSTSDMEAIMEKIINYEKCNFSDKSFLRRQLFVSGTDNEYSSTYGNGQIEYVITNYANSYNNIDTLVYPYYLNSYRHGSSSGLGYGVMSSASVGAKKSIINNINKGVGFVNYTGHGEEYSWEDPYISTTEVNNLQSNNLYGFWIANCCLTASYQKSESLSESALRKQGGGAVGYIGAGNLTYWDDDFYWAVGALYQPGQTPNYQSTSRGVFDGLYHFNKNEENIANQYITAGEIINCGNIAVMESNSPGIAYYWEIYNLAGDPSMMPYMSEPEDINVSLSPEKISVGISFLDIKTEPFAMVGFSQNGVLISSGFADKNGNLTLQFDAGSITTGVVDLVVSAQNKIPFIKSFDVSRPTEVYVSLVDYNFLQNPTVGNESILNLTFENIAENIENKDFTAENVKIYLSVDNDLITIVNPEVTIGSMSVGQANTEKFLIKVADSYPFGTLARFNLKVTTDNGFEQEFSFSTQILSYDIEQQFIYLTDTLSVNKNNNVTIFSTPQTKVDSNSFYEYNVETRQATQIDGILQAGETAQLKFRVTNTGNCDIENLSVALSSNCSNILINNSVSLISKLKVGDLKDVFFDVFFNEKSDDENIIFRLTSTYGQFSKVYEFPLKVNNVKENFENNGKIPPHIVVSERNPWTVDSVNAVFGKYCLKSGKIGSKGSSYFEINSSFSNEDTIYFDVKISCEDGYVFDYYDNLTFSVDDQTMGVWFGKNDWKTVKFTIPKGKHVLRWTYQKDEWDTMYDDCAWIDNIVFPKGSYKVCNGLTIMAQGLPSWLNFIDNGDGTGLLSGTSPNNGDLSLIKITAFQNDSCDVQDFVLYYGDIMPNNSIKVFPNPAIDNVNIYIDKMYNFNKLTIYNQRGQKVLEKNGITNFSTINVRNLGKGGFIFQFSGNAGIVRKKVVIL